MGSELNKKMLETFVEILGGLEGPACDNDRAKVSVHGCIDMYSP